MDRPVRTHQKYGPTLVLRRVAAFVALTLLPLAVGVIGPVPEARSFWVELGVGIGFVAIGVIAVQFLVSGRFRWVAPLFGSDVVLQFHRQIGIAAIVLVLAHPIVVILADGDNLSYFDPRDNLLRAIALVTAVVASIALLATSVRRTWFRLQYEHWRALHGVLAALLLFIGAIHGIQVGRHLGTLWQKAIWAAVLGAALWLVVHSRIVRPWSMRRRPYRVVEVRKEVRDVVTLRLAADGHDGMHIKPGQFTWMTLGDSPFGLQQHPFSFSSSAHDSAIELTAKALGDFTQTWSDIEVGTKAFLEGPYGGFTLDDEAHGAVLIAGGIGITPIMSILRTAADRGDRRPFTLFYATSRLERAPFREEIARLALRLDLQVHHVLDDPPTEWKGLSGYIDRDKLDAYLPAERQQLEYFICGPEPLMDASESALRELGISWRQIYTERFQVV